MLLQHLRAARQAGDAGSVLHERPAVRELVHAEHRPWRLGATPFVVFGMLALVAAAVGLYGVISYEATQPVHEIGIRMALGARPRHTLRLVLWQGGRLAAAGTALGGGEELRAAALPDTELDLRPMRPTA